MTQQNVPGQFYPRSFSYIYPLAGADRLPQATRYAIDVEDAFERRRATLVPLAIPAESVLYPADPDLEWVDGGIRAQWTARGYGEVDVYRADPRTGGAVVTAREAVKPLVTVTSTSLRAAPELGGELVVSERSGWAQLYLVRPDDPNGGIPLTRGDWEVINIDRRRRGGQDDPVDRCRSRGGSQPLLPRAVPRRARRQPAGVADTRTARPFGHRIARRQMVRRCDVEPDRTDAHPSSARRRTGTSSATSAPPMRAR